MENIFYIEEEPTLEELEEMEETEEEMDSASDSYYSDDSVKMYLYEISKIPSLKAEEEAELAKIIAQGGPEAKEARDKFVSANLRLVVHCAKKFLNRGVDFADLNSMGIEGLFKAVEKFDYTLGYKFSTYATWWINNAIARGIANESATVRVPVHMKEVVRKVRKAEEILKQETMKEPTVEEIAAYTNLPADKVMAAFEAAFSIVSFDCQIGEDGDMKIEDVLADENAIDPQKAAEQSDLKAAVRSVLTQLPPKDALVLKLRYGIDVPNAMTLEEIASLPGFMVTRERIRQIEEKTIRNIRRSHSMRSKLEEYALAG